MSNKGAGKQTNNTNQRVEPWMSPDDMADPMTGGYGKTPTDIGSFLFLVAVAVVPFVLCVGGIIVAITQETIDANKELHSHTPVATTSTADELKETPRVTYNTPPQGSAAQSYASDNVKIEYETVDLFDNMVIDIPKGAVKADSDEGVCYELPDGSLRVLVVRIPDPEDAYPKNLFDYCEKRGIDLEGTVDPDGGVSFSAESVETDDDGNKIYVEEEFPSYRKNDYRVRVESKENDPTVSSHILFSLGEKTENR